MATSKAKKSDTLESVRKILKSNQNLVVTEYRGLNVAKMTELRSSLRKNGITYKVLKNTLIRKALHEAGIEKLDKQLSGPVGIGFLSQDVSTSVKSILNFAKANELFVIKAGLIDGQAVTAEGLKAIAALPSREVLLAQLLGTIQAPLRGLMTVMRGNTQKLVYTLHALEEQRAKQAA